MNITRSSLVDVAAPEGASVAEVVGADVELHERVADRIEALRPEIRQLAIDLYENPELGFQEYESVARIVDLLRGYGHEAVVGAHGLETAFVASTSTANAAAAENPLGDAERGVTPHFAFVAEYDALPEIGHACGHNIIAAIGTAAFLGLAPELDGIGVPATVSLIGAPAEEGGAGKEHLLRAGAFQGVDAAAMVHPSVGDSVTPIYGTTTSGVRRLKVRYEGRAAHAALSPHIGLNALDAVVTAYQSIAQLRQHILPIDRVHGIITKGGTSANTVPDVTEAEFLIRSTDIDELKLLTDRVIAALEGAALATGTTAHIDLDFEPPYLPLKQNVELAKRFAVHLEGRGRAVPLRDENPRQGGPSTDMGNVSWAIPSIHPALGLGGPEGVLPHMADFAQHTVTDAAIDAAVDAAIALAGVAADFLADAGLRGAASAEFEAQGGVRRWQS